MTCLCGHFEWCEHCSTKPDTYRPTLADFAARLGPSPMALRPMQRVALEEALRRDRMLFGFCVTDPAGERIPPDLLRWKHEDGLFILDEVDTIKRAPSPVRHCRARRERERERERAEPLRVRPRRLVRHRRTWGRRRIRRLSDSNKNQTYLRLGPVAEAAQLLLQVRHVGLHCRTALERRAVSIRKRYRGAGGLGEPRRAEAPERRNQAAQHHRRQADAAEAGHHGGLAFGLGVFFHRGRI